MRRLSHDRLVTTASPIVLLCVWEVAARTGLVDARILPPPTAVVQMIYTMVLKQGLAEHTAWTMGRFFVGLVVGLVPGVFIGLSMGLFRSVRLIIIPLLAIFYTVPRIALFPIVMIFVGLNETSNLIMIALGPFFTMIITAMGAVMNVDPIYRDVAKNFNAQPRHLYFMVTLPSIAPALMDGLRLSVGLALLGTISVEFLVSDTGLGHVIWHSWELLSLTQSMAGVVVAAFFGFLVYFSVDLLERWLVPWQKPTTFT
jgi:ABC-type nitrate/sulfonate/bicarbonate transport system permease component